MKKLQLNKRAIAQLNNPESIQGGERLSGAGCWVAVAESGLTNKMTVCVPSEKWACPSNGQWTYCHNQCVQSGQLDCGSCGAAQ